MTFFWPDSAEGMVLGMFREVSENIGVENIAGRLGAAN